MLKAIASFAAFLLLVVSLSSFTTGVFLSAATANFDSVQSGLKGVLLTEGLNSFHANLKPDAKAQLDQLDKLSPAERKTALMVQCRSSDQPYCNPDFITGKINLDEAIRINFEKQIDSSQSESLAKLNDVMQTYANHPYLLIAIISGLMSLGLYYFVNRYFGIQSFFANATWLSLLSVISFNFMLPLLDHLVSAFVPGQLNQDPALLTAAKQVILSWMAPAIQKAFVVSIWLTVVSFVVWMGMKFFRTYTVTAETY